MNQHFVSQGEKISLLQNLNVYYNLFNSFLLMQAQLMVYKLGICTYGQELSCMQNLLCTLIGFYDNASLYLPDD